MNSVNKQHVLSRLINIKNQFNNSGQTPNDIDKVLSAIESASNNAFYQHTFMHQLNVKHIDFTSELIDVLEHPTNDNERQQNLKALFYLKKTSHEFAHVMNPQEPLHPSDVFDTIDALENALKSNQVSQDYNMHYQPASTEQILRAKSKDKARMLFYGVCLIIVIILAFKWISMVF